MLKSFRTSWVLSVIPSAMVVWFIPGPNQYITSTQPFSRTEQQIVFEDLNGDGLTEFISYSTVDQFHHGRVNVADNEQNLYDQWNVWDSLSSNISSLYFGNYDHDKLKEIYLFSQRRDSLFLNVNEFFDSSGLHLNRAFVSKYARKGNHDVTIAVCGMFDHNNDGKEELYFSITTGYGLWPRLIYFYDLVTRQVKSSPYTSINLNFPEMKDVDGDSRPEIFGSSSASGNHHFPTPYSDYRAWIMVYSDNLDLKFPPIGFDGFGSATQTKGINAPAFKGYACILNENPATSKEKSRIMIVSQNGKIKKERTLEELNLSGETEIEVFSFQHEQRVLLFANPIHILNEDLEVVKKIELPEVDTKPHDRIIHLVYDINQDGKDDLIVRLADNQTYLLFDQDLNFVSTFKLPVAMDYPRISTFHSNTETKLAFKTPDLCYFVTLVKNPYYFLGILIYPGIYIGFVLFISLIQKTTESQIEKREKQKRRIQELQLRSIKGQFDPHFTFNALNAIGSMLQLEDRNVAYDYLSRFTGLLRQLIADSDRVYRTLEEELEFVTAYLNLEKMRFEEKFNFTISVGNRITKKEMVPIMCIQIFVENAIRHGIMPLESGGKVTVSIEKQNDHLRIVIEDNGVGRLRARQLQPVTGKGLKMATELYEILNQTRQNKIHYTIQDLDDGSGNPSGTRVEVVIPDL